MVCFLSFPKNFFFNYSNLSEFQSQIENKATTNKTNPDDSFVVPGNVATSTPTVSKTGTFILKLIFFYNNQVAQKAKPSIFSTDNKPGTNLFGTNTAGTLFGGQTTIQTQQPTAFSSAPKTQDSAAAATFSAPLFGGGAIGTAPSLSSTFGTTSSLPAFSGSASTTAFGFNKGLSFANNQDNSSSVPSNEGPLMGN